MTPKLRQALLAQYNAHKSWSAQLHHDNLAALAETRPELQPVPSYTTVRRFLVASGLTRRRAELQNNGGYHYPKHQTPWQEIQRGMVAQFDEGMVLKPAVKYQDVAHTSGVNWIEHIIQVVIAASVGSWPRVAPKAVANRTVWITRPVASYLYRVT